MTKLNSTTEVAGIFFRETQFSKRQTDLWNQFCKINTLEQAWLKVKQNKGKPGVDGMTIENFQNNLSTNLYHIQKHLGHYQPKPLRRILINKSNGKTRPIDIPCVCDRVVLRALHNILSPILDSYFPENSYGFRPKRSALDAILQAEKLITKGNVWAVHTDIQNFFGSIRGDLALQFLAPSIGDYAINSLVGRFIKATISERGYLFHHQIGIPQGICISPLIGNFYLLKVDNLLNLIGCNFVRYADDILILSDSRDKTQFFLNCLITFLEPLGLQLNLEKTAISHLSDGFDFLGYRFSHDRKTPTQKAINRINSKLIYIASDLRITSEQKIGALRSVFSGWFSYFKTFNGMSFPDVYTEKVFRNYFASTTNCEW